MSNREFTDDYMEGLLRDHFKAEVAQQPASKHPWDWLKSRLETPYKRTRLSELMSFVHSGMVTMSKSLIVALPILIVLIGVVVFILAPIPTDNNGMSNEGFTMVSPPQSPVPSYSGMPGQPGNPGSSVAPTPDSAHFTVSGGSVLSSRQGPPGAPGLPGNPGNPGTSNSSGQQSNQALVNSLSPSQRASTQETDSQSTKAATSRLSDPDGAPAPAPSATTFKDYERSKFVSTAQDSFSTFSLDTDRTSFQLALNWARSGHTVEPDSVRAEEWINSFNYGYESSGPYRDSFAITTDVFRHPLNSRYAHGPPRIPGARASRRCAPECDARTRCVRLDVMMATGLR